MRGVESLGLKALLGPKMPTAALARRILGQQNVRACGFGVLSWSGGGTLWDSSALVTCGCAEENSDRGWDGGGGRGEGGVS